MKYKLGLIQSPFEKTELPQWDNYLLCWEKLISRIGPLRRTHDFANEGRSPKACRETFLGWWCEKGIKIVDGQRNRALALR